MSTQISTGTSLRAADDGYLAEARARAAQGARLGESARAALRELGI
jgi:hypothetical protein